MMRLLSFVLATTLFALPGIPSGHAGTAASRPAAGGVPDSLFADPAATTIHWTSASDGASGDVALRSGLIVIRHQRIIGGRLLADMSTMGARITNSSFVTPARSPYVAQLALRDGEHIGNGDYRLEGDLTVHGLTKPVTFLAHASWPETGHLVAEGRYTLRPEDWGVQGSTARNPIVVDLTLHARRRVPRVASR